MSRMLSTNILSFMQVVGVSGLGSGNAIANVGSETDTSVVISGTTNVNFQHGFSEFKPRSINGTVTRPILGNLNTMVLSKNIDVFSCIGHVMNNIAFFR